MSSFPLAYIRPEPCKSRPISFLFSQQEFAILHRACYIQCLCLTDLLLVQFPVFIRESLLVLLRRYSLYAYGHIVKEHVMR